MPGRKTLMAGGIGAITATALLFGSLDTADQRAEARTFAGTAATSTAATPQVDRGSTGAAGARSQPTPDVLSTPANPPIDGAKGEKSVGVNSAGADTNTKNSNKNANKNGKAAQNGERMSSAKKSNSDTRSERADTQKRSCG